MVSNDPKENELVGEGKSSGVSLLGLGGGVGGGSRTEDGGGEGSVSQSPGAHRGSSGQKASVTTESHSLYEP